VNKNTQHNKLAFTNKQSKNFFAKGSFRWKRTSNEVWADMEASISEKPVARKNIMRPLFFSAAAVLLLLIGLTGFFYFYTKTISVPAGQHIAAVLPDGSSVQLNAQSEISFKPYWWKINREAYFYGEAFFDVAKGKTFAVISSEGTTEVVGTSFNIFARESYYIVTCVTGNVKVTSLSNQNVLLGTNSRAVVLPDGEINVDNNIDTFPEISWKNNYFQFTATPLKEVLSEIERQYNVHIKMNTGIEANYTGNFSRKNNVEEVLGLICPAFGLTYKKTEPGSYLIISNNE
jgi:ferric-dicitrate binding protein FerR (iron transport regulator)